MGLRFRRSIKLAPGLRFNVTGGGASLTVGPRGASVNFGSRGVFLNSGIPGTGLYSRSRLSGAPSTPVVPSGKVYLSATISIQDDGTLTYLDEQGSPLSSYLITLAKRQQGDKIRRALAEASERVNSEVEALAHLHYFTPAPGDAPTRPRREFQKNQPKPPVLRKITFINRLFGKRAAIERENANKVRKYEQNLTQWKHEKALFDENEDAESRRFDQLLRTDTEFMQQVLEDNLQDISWPRETLVSFEVRDAGKSVVLDVDLSEIEDMPRKITAVPRQGYKLTVKELKGKALHDLYARHVCGVGFRLLGEVFATLPTVETVTLSAFTQRAAPNTGQQSDTYIYSVRVTRDDWAQIDFTNLAAIDVTASFESFALRRRIARNGVFEAVEPFDAD